MKSAAAFSIGLWTGAAVVAAVGVFYVQRERTRSQLVVTDQVRAELATTSVRVLELQQENARLQAELQRFRETASELKSNLEEQAAVVEPRRRTPFNRTRDITVVEAAAEPWIEDAVVRGDTQALPRLEQAALANDRFAVEALALLAERGGAEALVRVWRAPGLTLPNRLKATRFLAATLEVNPAADDLVRAVAEDPATDVRLMYGLVDGLTTPNFRTSLGRSAAIPPPPHFRPDYAARLRLLDYVRQYATDERLRAYLDQSRDALLARWDQAEPGHPQ